MKPLHLELRCAFYLLGVTVVFVLSSGDGWQQPSLLRHDSVDSGVAKGSQGGLGGGPGWKETPSWHGAQRGQEAPHHHHARHIKRCGGERDRQGGHRQRNGNFLARKGGPYHERYSDEERNDDKLKFVDEDFVSSVCLLAYNM